jgi:hypothetical protein
MVLPFIFGAASAGMGIMQGIAGNQAAQQDYLNQKAYQEANNKFAMWQAGFNAKVNNANAQYGYWAETVNYNQTLAYAKSMRNLEVLKAAKQAEVVMNTRAAAGASYVQDSEALTQQFSEASMQEAVALQQYQWRSLQARSSVQAMAMEGNSVDRLVNDYARQLGDQATLQQINKGLRTRQYTREQAGQVAQYLSRYSSQQFYEETQVIDPAPPFAPLPSMITPSAPTFTGGGPSGAAAAIGIGTGILGGINAGIGMANQIKILERG